MLSFQTPGLSINATSWAQTVFQLLNYEEFITATSNSWNLVKISKTETKCYLPQGLQSNLLMWSSLKDTIYFYWPLWHLRWFYLSHWPPCGLTDNQLSGLSVVPSWDAHLYKPSSSCVTLSRVIFTTRAVEAEVKTSAAFLKKVVLLWLAVRYWHCRTTVAPSDTGMAGVLKMTRPSMRHNQ